MNDVQRAILLPVFLLFILPFGMMAWVISADEHTSTYRVSAAEPLSQDLVGFLAENRPVSYSQDIQPLFNQRCVICHGPNSIAGSPPNGLLLDTYENTMLGSLFLPVVRPGEPENSTIVLLTRSGGMPAIGPKLTEAQLQLIENWIAQGARDN